MKFLTPIFITLCMAVHAPLRAQEVPTVYDYWKLERGNASQYLYQGLSDRAFSLLEKRQGEIGKLQTQTDWQRRQAYVRQQLAKALGPLPEKTPLQPVVTGIVRKMGYTVEKLYYQSRPGYYVSAALFLPNQRAQKAPAIIFCSGHTDQGFRSETYQQMILNYVDKGFIVLAFDPIGQGERIQYQDTDLFKGATKEHSYPGAQSFLAGISPAQYFIWDGIRSVDYLLSRPEVDPLRIGITGRSGGGTQSAYIAAVDDRILAAAPECYITSFDKLLRSNGPQDAEQNLLHALKNGLDLADLLEVRAPKPTLIVATTRDMFSIQGARDSYMEARKAFKAFGKIDHMNMTEDDAGHASTLKNRESTYAFFQKYLQNPGSSKDKEVEPLSDEELMVSPPTLKTESMFSLNKTVVHGLVEKREMYRKTNPGYEKTLMDRVIRLSGYEKPATKVKANFSGREQRPGYTIEKYLVKGSGTYHLPVLWLKPSQASTKTILYLDDQGKSMAARTGGTVEQLVRNGYEVVVPDLSGIGELGPGTLPGGDAQIDGVPLNLWFMGLLVQKNLVAVRAEEIAILSHFIKNTKTDATLLGAVASGTLTADLLHAAAIENPFHRLVLHNPLVSYQSIAEERLYRPKFVLSAVPGALPLYDLPDLVHRLSTQRLLLANPVTAADREVSPSQTEALYGRSIQKEHPENFSVKTGLRPDDWLPVLLKWLD